MEGDAIRVQEVMAYKMLPRQAATEVLEKALAKAGLSLEQVTPQWHAASGERSFPMRTGMYRKT